MIELKHIELAYESGSELLRNINMQVNDGEYIAIVGENGSGKSTLVKRSWDSWSRQKVN